MCLIFMAEILRIYLILLIKHPKHHPANQKTSPMTNLITIITLFFAVSVFQPVTAQAEDSSTETITLLTLKVQNSEVLLLDEKPLHIDFLSAVLMDRQITGEFGIKLSISPDAPMGLVSDTKLLLNELGIETGLEY